MAASTSKSCDEEALKKALAHFQQIVKMDKLMPELDKCKILTESDLQEINAYQSNYNKVAYLAEMLPQRSEDWWDHLLTSLKASDDIQLKLAARILEIEKHSAHKFKNDQQYGEENTLSSGFRSIHPLVCLPVTSTLLEGNIKDRQTTLMSCCGEILDAGVDLANISIQYNNQFFNKTWENPDSTIPSTNNSSDIDDAPMQDSATSKIINDDQSAAFHKQLEEMVADDGIEELQKAFEADNYDAMREQQSRYALVSSGMQNNLVSSHIDELEQEMGNAFLGITIPKTATEEQTKSLIEMNVKFATTLNSYLEAIHSAYDKGFDLSNIIIITLKHPAFKSIYDNMMAYLAESIEITRTEDSKCNIL